MVLIKKKKSPRFKGLRLIFDRNRSYRELLDVDRLVFANFRNRGKSLTTAVSKVIFRISLPVDRGVFMRYRLQFIYRSMPVRVRVGSRFNDAGLERRLSAPSGRRRRPQKGFLKSCLIHESSSY